MHSHGRGYIEAAFEAAASIMLMAEGLEEGNNTARAKAVDLSSCKQSS
jgi:hypothetical protein